MPESSQEIIDRLIKDIEGRQYDASGGNKKCFITDDYALLHSTDINPSKMEELIKIVSELEERGINVVKVLGYKILDGNKTGYILQNRAKGEELHNWVKWGMPEDRKQEERQRHIDKLVSLSRERQDFFDKFVSDWLEIQKAGIRIDPSKPTNFFYEKGKAISFIDLDGRMSETNNPTLEECCHEMLIVLSGQVKYSALGRDSEFMSKVNENYKKIFANFARAMEKQGMQLDDILSIIEYRFPEIDINEVHSLILTEEQEYPGMKPETIKSELVKWEDETFLTTVSEELGQYVNELDRILYKRYKERISKLSPEDKNSAMKGLKFGNLLDENMNYIGASNIVRLDSEAAVANAAYDSNKGEILVNPNSARQFYAAYSDFSNGMIDGIREFDYKQPLSELEDLSSLEILYWYYINGKTYQDFLKMSMLHEDVHRWTLSASMLDDPIDIFTMEGLVETEAREVASENNIEYANCFRNDEVNLINYFDNYNKVDKPSMMLCYSSDVCLRGMILQTIIGGLKAGEIETKDRIALMNKIYNELNGFVDRSKKSSVGKNYREVFAEIKPDKSLEMIDFIRETIEKERAKKKQNSILKSGVEATEQTTRTGQINSQVQTLTRENQQKVSEQGQIQSE